MDYCRVCRGSRRQSDRYGGLRFNVGSPPKYVPRKRDTTVCADRRRLTSQKVSVRQVCVTDPEGPEGEFNLRRALNHDCHTCTEGFKIGSLLSRALLHSACHEDKIARRRREQTSVRKLGLRRAVRT
jgi:hypothetical protein